MTRFLIYYQNRPVAEVLGWEAMLAVRRLYTGYRHIVETPVGFEVRVAGVTP